MTCIFCKIVAGEIPAKIVHEDEDFLVFHDIHPKAKVHVLVIPKQHIDSLATLTQADADLIAKLTLSLPKVASLLRLSGFRTVINTGAEGGQEVFHLHYHVLGGH